MGEDHTLDPPSQAYGSSKATAGESSSQSRSGVKQLTQKFKNVLTKQLPKRFKRSRNRIPVAQTVDHGGSSSNQNIEDTSRLHDSTGHQRPTISENPSGGCVNQGSSGEPASQVQVALSAVHEGTDPRSVDAALQNAREGTEKINLLGGLAKSAAFTAKNAPVGLSAADETAYLQPLRIFDIVIKRIANVHPYTKMALGVLSAASIIILAQADRDQAVKGLLDKLEQVYGFMTQDDTLGNIESMRDIVGKIAQQTQECARFIRDYSETKIFWKRLGKNVVSETDSMIKQYCDALDGLMQQFRDQDVQGVPIFVQCTGETLDLSGMNYAAGAGLDTTKQCLPGTRTDVLSQITDWINCSRDDAQRVLWLSGPAGTGKSAIAHTIANWFDEMGGLGSCFCFDRQREADKRHEKVFSTIARDLADRDPEMRRALANAVKNAISLQNTTDIIQQWRKLLMEPLGKLSGSSAQPVLIVIEALDESGRVETRRNLLRILAGKLRKQGVPNVTELPPNFRILVTSRPLHDIDKEFEGAQHILRLSMDDIPPEVAERDIRTYISEELEELEDFQNKEFAVLAARADGLFEWARLASEYIKQTPTGLYPMDRFNAIVSRDPAERKNLLYDMYSFILAENMGRDKYTNPEYERALTRFRSVMGQILGSAEPLPLDALNAMRIHLPDESEHYKVEVVVKHLGSLLSGTTNSCTPIRPLHASFQEFLTDKSSSEDFFVEVSEMRHRDLAFASLQVMEQGLRFNICDLNSSYLANREDTGLPQRVKSCILPHLSYSCRFWATHVRATDFDTELAKEIKSFFNYERLLFWIEVLGLLNTLSCVASARLLISQWLQGHSGYEDVLSSAIDVQRFVQVFGGMILHSTPHLYISALPFSPSNSAIATKFTAGFPNSLLLTSGRDLNWTAAQSEIRHTSRISSVSFSPDGTRIVSCSEDKTLRLWDAATVQPLGEPLRGHTDAVSSASFSPDGTRIVSGSRDNTIRLWDAATGQSLGEPLLGHTHSVWSVSFSPDGTRIVSGSQDNTVRLWDAATGQPLGEPFRGHTKLVWSVSFSPDGTRVVSGSRDNTLRLWNAVTGQPLGEPLRGHTHSVWSVSFSPDGTRIVSGSQDNTVRLWDAATGQPLGEPFQGHTNSVWSVSFSPDGTRIVSGSQDKTIRLWDAATGQPLGEPLRGHIDLVSSVSFSPDGTRIVSGSRDETIRLWDAVMGQPLSGSLREHTDSVLSVSFSPNGTRIVSGSEDTSIRLWDAVTGQPLGEPLWGHTSSVLSVSFSPDGTRIVSGSQDNTIRLWDAATAQPLGEPFRGHTNAVSSVSFSPDGTRVVSGSSDKTVRLWDVATGQPLGEPLEGHTDWVSSVSFSPDGTRIVSGSQDNTIRLWDVVMGQPLGEPLRGHTGSVWSVSFSPDGTRIVSGSADTTVRLWDAVTGQSLGEPLLGHTNSVLSVSFSPDGSRIVSGSGNVVLFGSSDNTVQLWDAVTRQALGDPLLGHTDFVLSVSFSPDGTRIVSGSQDNTVRLWNAVTAQPFQDYTETNSSAFSLDRSPTTPHTQENHIMSSNMWNNHVVNFSSNLEYALHNPAELLENTSRHDFGPTPFFLAADGWMVGPNHRLLFWVPPASRCPFYTPGTALVIPRGGVELDLSRMANGKHWSNCRDTPTPR